MNRCAICEERFTVWSEYAAHKLKADCIKKILPVRTTSRTKAQIVHDVETMGVLKGYVIS